jgi:2'-5' RNA ligase
LTDAKIRSFIAVEVDDAAVQAAVQRLQSEISAANADVKLVAPENIHVTLRFLGEIPISATAQICDALQRVRFTPFHTELRGVGCFPRLDRIRVLWIGMERGVTELTNLYNETQTRLQRCGIAPDRRRFRPHITIGRVRSRKNMDRLAQVVTGLAHATIGVQAVTAIKLKKSELTPKGPIYTSLCEIPAITERPRGR